MDLLSPSLLSLDDAGKKSKTDFSHAMITDGLGNNDQNDWLNLIFEASGVNDQMNDLKVSLFTKKLR